MARIHLISALLLLAAACAAPVRAQSPAAPGSETNNHAAELAAYRVGPEDVLNIVVWKNDGISRTVPVRPDGMISLPLLNDVQAAGLTPMELRDVIMKKLAEYEPNPEVSVIVQEVRSFKVSVIGSVKTPGRYELKSRATVLDVLALAGGLGEFASRARILILRPAGAGMKRLVFNYNKVVSSDGEQENLLLHPGDIVVVP
jgi:polysaccharide export outer membrane protein